MFLRLCPTSSGGSKSGVEGKSIQIDQSPIKWSNNFNPTADIPTPNAADKAVPNNITNMFALECYELKEFLWLNKRAEAKLELHAVSRSVN